MVEDGQITTSELYKCGRHTGAVFVTSREPRETRKTHQDEMRFAKQQEGRDKAITAAITTNYTAMCVVLASSPVVRQYLISPCTKTPPSECEAVGQTPTACVHSIHSDLRGNPAIAGMKTEPARLGLRERLYLIILLYEDNVAMFRRSNYIPTRHGLREYPGS
jgi:hypothetical protein